jgi:predicted 3-demethylubiquinone-9 3-methyltransferase (glyoxalase superfamily)
MTQKIRPCLWFDDQAEEAARFYVSLFPDSEITNITHYGPGAPKPEGTVLTVDFRLDGREFIALNGGPEFPLTEAVSFSIDCGSQAEVDRYWEKLTDGGEPSQCGWLKDRYGLSWQVVPSALIEMLRDEDRDKANRVMQAMLQMSKIDIPTLERAYAGT